MSIRSLASLLALAAATLPACADEAPQGSLGQLQNLRFELQTPAPCMDCGPDRDLPVGSVADVGIYNLGRKVHFQVRSTDPTVADFHAVPRCMFLDEAGCHEVVSARGHHPGQADLEVFDEWTGTVLDRYTVKVVDLSALELKSKH